MVKFRSFHQQSSDDDDDEDHKVVLGEWLRPLRRRVKKYRSLNELMKITPRIENIIEEDGDGDGYGDGECRCSNVESEQCSSKENPDDHDKYSHLVCEQCQCGEKPEELLLCDKCDRGFHMSCHRPVVVRVPFGPWFCHGCSGRNLLPPQLQCFSKRKIMNIFKIGKCGGSSPAQVVKKQRKRARARSLLLYKKPRRIRPFVPIDDITQRMTQLGSLATALKALNMEFSNSLTYVPSMAPKNANNATFEKNGIQILRRKDEETVAKCITMYNRGECPPLIVVYDTGEGYTVEADAPIKDMSFIAEYTGDVDYLKNREHDDCDSLMTLISATDSSKSLVVCPDKRGNISRFINGINNKNKESKKRRNVKCVRYDVNGECRVLLVATRDIHKGERLYYDYNGQEHEYPTDHFI